MNPLTKTFETLITGPLKPSKEIVSILSADLPNIDESVLSKYTDDIDKIGENDMTISSTSTKNQNDIDTEKLKELALACRDKSYAHYEWSKLAGRIRMVYIK